jgi:hypothetical protein
MLKEVLNQAAAKTATAKAAEHAAKNHTGEGKAIDPKFGVKLFKDRRVPVGKKVLALFLGFTTIGLAELLDFPLEVILAPVLGLLSIPLEIASEAIEYTVGVLAISATILPHISPKMLVQQIRAENTFNTVTVPNETVGDLREIPSENR